MLILSWPSCNFIPKMQLEPGSTKATAPQWDQPIINFKNIVPQLRINKITDGDILGGQWHS